MRHSHAFFCELKLNKLKVFVVQLYEHISSNVLFTVMVLVKSVVTIIAVYKTMITVCKNEVFGTFITKSYPYKITVFDISKLK